MSDRPAHAPRSTRRCIEDAGIDTTGVTDDQLEDLMVRLLWTVRVFDWPPTWESLGKAARLSNQLGAKRTGRPT